MKSVNLVNWICPVLLGLASAGHAQGDIVLEEELVSGVTEGVTVSVRCPGGGTAIGGGFVASRANVALVEGGGVDCAGGGCSAWQMTFASESPEAFSVTAKARCEGVELEPEPDPEAE